MEVTGKQNSRGSYTIPFCAQTSSYHLWSMTLGWALACMELHWLIYNTAHLYLKSQYQTHLHSDWWELAAQAR